MDPQPFIKNEWWIHSLLLKINKNQAAGLQPKPPASICLSISYWIYLFFLEIPRGRPSESEKTWFFHRFDTDWTVAENQSFRQRAELIARREWTEGSFKPEHSISCRIARCFGAHGAQGMEKMEKFAHRSARVNCIQNHRNLNTSVLILSLESLIKISLPLQTSPYWFDTYRI